MLSETCRIRLMVPEMDKNGSLCLGDTSGNADSGIARKRLREEVVKNCKLWAASGRNDDQALNHWLDAVLPSDGGGKAEGAYLNLTMCEVLSESIDDDCAFDMNAVNEFSRKLKTSDGFSLAFWIKAVDSSSLSESGKFFPQLSLLHRVSPPEPFLVMSKRSDWTYNTLDMRSYDSNEPVKRSSFLQDLSPSNWNFVAISNKFGSSEGDYASFAVQNSRVLSNYRGLDFLKDRAIFQAIEVNTPMLISPIMLVPEFRLARELQEEYNTHVDLMAIRGGPVTTDRVRKQTRVPVGMYIRIYVTYV